MKTPSYVANFLVKKYDTRNPFQIAKEKNVILVTAPLIDIRGFYQYFKRQHIIYIDENLKENQKEFVCAHEIGHMMMHRNSNAIFMDSHTFFNTNKYENEANEFAVNLLISNEMIYENRKLTIEQLSRLLGYEEAIIKLRLKSYKTKS